MSSLTFSPQISYLKNLQEMDLSQNKLFIYGFPTPIVQCKALVKLNVSDNQLDDLPDALCELESLRELDVSNNMIKTFPPDMARPLFFLSSSFLTLSSGQDGQFGHSDHFWLQGAGSSS